MIDNTDHCTETTLLTDSLEWNIFYLEIHGWILEHPNEQMALWVAQAWLGEREYSAEAVYKGFKQTDNVDN